MAPPLELSTLVCSHLDSRDRHTFAFVAERMWLDFVNSDSAVRGSDALYDFERFVRWLEAAHCSTRSAPQRCAAARISSRRAHSPSSATRGAFAPSCARSPSAATRRTTSAVDALAEINRVLGRSAGTRRLELQATAASCAPSFPSAMRSPDCSSPSSRVRPMRSSSASSSRVRRCADPRCARVFQDETKNGRRRWCDMATCGNRAKAARHRMKLHR